MSGKRRNNGSIPVLKSDGGPCSLAEEILSRWREHFNSVLNFRPIAPCSQLKNQASNTPLNEDVNINEPTIEEIRSSITRLKYGRASRIDGIAPELLRHVIGPISVGLQTLISKTWTSGRVPAYWRDGIIIPLYKGKGSEADCSSYRPISLLSVPGKIFESVLLGRLKLLLTERRRPEQSGFTAGRSAADSFLTLRLLSELLYQFQRPLHVAYYVDLKLALDSFDRSALWQALRGVGIPSILLDLLRSG